MAYVIKRAFWFHSPCTSVPSHLIYCTLDHIKSYIHSSTKRPRLTRHNHSSKMAEVPNNFVLLNDNDIAELIDVSDATNTKKQIKLAVRRLESYVKCTGTSLEVVEAYSDAELDQFLSRFYGGLRRDNGALYTFCLFLQFYPPIKWQRSTWTLQKTNNGCFAFMQWREAKSLVLESKSKNDLNCLKQFLQLKNLNRTLFYIITEQKISHNLHSCVWCLIHNDRFSSLVHVMLQPKICSNSMDYHTMIWRHRWKFTNMFSEKTTRTDVNSRLKPIKNPPTLAELQRQVAIGVKTTQLPVLTV